MTTINSHAGEDGRPAGPRVSLVTGAGSGIGSAVAATLAERGDRVVCADLDLAAAQRVAAGLPGALAIEADVTSAESMTAAVDEAWTRLGPVTALVCSAGIEIGGPAETLSAEVFRRTFDVNVVGALLSAQAVAVKLIDAGRPGSIVMIASANSHVALPGQAAYAASKGAVLMLTKSLAVDWAPYGITTNAVGPGVTDTPMSARSLGDPQKRDELMSGIPLRRPAQPAEIASAVAYLASTDARYITGAFLPVDGGWLAQG